MNLKVQNIGKVRLGTVKLSGLTVVAGPNSAGKSTLGRCLVTYSNLCRRMDALVRNRKITRFAALLVKLLKLSDFTLYYLGRYMRDAMEADKVFAEGSWNTAESIRKNLLGAAKNYREEVHLAEQLENAEIDVDAVLSALRQVVAAPTSAYAHEIIEERFRRTFERQINPLADPKAAGFVAVFENDGDEPDSGMAFTENKLTAIPAKFNFQLPPVFYIEPFHMLDICGGVDELLFASELAERYGVDEFGIDSVMRNRNYDVAYQDPAEAESVARLVAELIDVIRGGLESVGEDEMRFRERLSDTESLFVELGNLASGAKTMSVVIHALRNGTLRRGMTLVIDEPESNLHPEWQIKFAHALVALNKRLSVKVLLNTHSPYFLKAVEFYAEREGVPGGAHYYLMQQAVGDALYTVQDCTGDTNRIFKTMYRPFEAIM